jgi:hypothetical protein
MDKMCQMSLSQEAAETVAVQALAWLAGNDELLPVFLGATGASEVDLRARVAEPEFLLSVLEFLMMDDAWVIEFCDEQLISYDRPMQARHALPGGAPTHWT